jgi:hypothetical protein
VLAILALGASVFALIQQHATNRRVRHELRELNWRTLLALTEHSPAVVDPTVGTIQFIKGGYSIEFSAVQYTSEGLRLSGFLGNPTHLTLYQVALRVTASNTKLTPSYDDFMKGVTPEPPSGDYIPMLSHEELGHAESSPIASLLPGGRSTFAVTVPNVKQSPEGFILEVRFSGSERYSY